MNLALHLDQVAWPDFSLDRCRESGALVQEPDEYHGHWYCRFVRMPLGRGGAQRLENRLRAAGFQILKARED